MADPVVIAATAALADIARSLTGGRVPAERVFVRVAGEFVPGRDRVPAVLAFETPGSPTTRRHTLSKKEVVYPVTVALVAASDGNPAAADPKDADDPQWRAAWREAFAAAAHGRPAGLPDAVKRVTPDGDAILDAGLWERNNLWFAAVPLRVMCRFPLTG